MHDSRFIDLVAKVESLRYKLAVYQPVVLNAYSKAIDQLKPKVSECLVNTLVALYPRGLVTDKAGLVFSDDSCANKVHDFVSTYLVETGICNSPDDVAEIVNIESTYEESKLALFHFFNANTIHFVSSGDIDEVVATIEKTVMMESVKELEKQEV